MPEEDDEETLEEEDGDIYLAVCDVCGASHLLDIDVMSLGRHNLMPFSLLSMTCLSVYWYGFRVMIQFP